MHSKNRPFLENNVGKSEIPALPTPAGISEPTFENRSRRGVALVMVLAVLVLLSTLIVAFFTNVTSEVTDTKTYQSGSDVRVLADTTVNLVISQIQEATRDPANVWTSQPGLIRTFNSSGLPAEAYKLYSATDLVVPGAVSELSSTDLDPGWASKPSLFVDLNAPVLSSDDISYPIIDPRAKNSVEGFDVPDLQLQDERGNAVTDAAGNSIPIAPMPVRWLYLLQDGTISPAVENGNVAEVSGASSANPMIGRIAFWTDDDSCKVNVNTASEGVFWDIPRAFTTSEVALARSQPAQNEFQRFPGHSATVCLSSVFGNLLTPEKLYDLAPRIQSGGSQGGTVQTGSAAGVALDADRLYASVGDLMFRPTLQGERREVNSSSSTSPDLLTREKLDMARFFLTQSSRAPELNLSNKPRISIWPVHADSARRSAFDHVSAFCATTGNRKYYFTRSNSESPVLDYSGSTRNRELYGYLQTLTSRGIPGFSATGFDNPAKYGDDRDQILTEIFDYVRCTNLVDTQTGNSFTPVSGPGRGQVTPIQIGSTRGFGRFDAIAEAALLIFADEYDVPNTQPKSIGAAFLLEMHSPSQGYPGLIPNYKVEVRGLNQLQFQWSNRTPVNFGFPQTAVNWVQSASGSHSRTWGGGTGIIPQLLKSDGTAKTTIPREGAGDPANYPFVSPIHVVNSPLVSKTVRYFRVFGAAAPIEVDIKSASGEILQTYKLRLPDFSNIATMNGALNKEVLGLEGKVRLVLQQLNTSSGNADSIINNSDTVRSVEPLTAMNDYRLVAARKDVPEGYFVKHPNYDLNKDSTGANITDPRNHAHAHTLRFGNGTSQANGKRSESATFGKLVNLDSVTPVSYPSRLWPDLPPGINGVTIRNKSTGKLIPGDWDNGIGDSPDGAYINKADEGSDVVVAANGAKTPYPYFSEAFDLTGQTFFSPNRQVSSPVMFGSLSTGVVRGEPWQTLLFRPDPTGQHPGSTGPKDHLLLDLFTMPVVDPYPISEPFSTAGKINLNQAIVPFGSITRTTALRAALKSTKIMAIPQAQSTSYKGLAYNRLTGDAFTPPSSDYRYAIDADATLTQLKEHLDQADREAFLSASEICEINLVPKPGASNPVKTFTSPADFWAQNSLTGDNSREMPYAHLYPLLTVRSNSFTVHLRVQALKKVPGTSATSFVEGRDQVRAEYRGAYLLERYIDPNDPRISAQFDESWFGPDSSGRTGSLNRFYKFRVAGSRQFAP